MHLRQVTLVVTELWQQLGASITGLLCALILRSMCHVASPAPRQKVLLQRLPFWSILLQIPRSFQGSGYILVCVDHSSRFVVLAPLRDKSAATVVQSLVSHLIFPYTTPRVLLTDNGTEFKNQVLADICAQYGVTQTFITAHHPASNGTWTFPLSPHHDRRGGSHYTFHIHCTYENEICHGGSLGNGKCYTPCPL